MTTMLLSCDGTVMHAATNEVRIAATTTRMLAVSFFRTSVGGICHIWPHPEKISPGMVSDFQM
jgi:hypothetical protein